ncbi:hypothetical protein Droror1_Dr00019257 [Drosera rotundifolia]
MQSEVGSDNTEACNGHPDEHIAEELVVVFVVEDASWAAAPVADAGSRFDFGVWGFDVSFGDGSKLVSNRGLKKLVSCVCEWIGSKTMRSEKGLGGDGVIPSGFVWCRAQSMECC